MTMSMTRVQAANLIVEARTIWPRQLTDLPDTAAEVWQEVLDGVEFDDAMTAITELARSEDWFTLAKLIAAVKDLRSRRLAAVPIDPGALPVDPDNAPHWRAEYAHIRELAADGEMDADGWRAYVAAGIPLTDTPRAIGSAPQCRPGR